MTEFLTEQLVKREKSLASIIKNILLIVIVLGSISFWFIHSMMVWVTVVLIVVVVILMKRMNLEFEYVYFNGDLDVDKIINKQSRKRVLSVNIKDMEVIAPTGSNELRPYERLKEYDFSSQNANNETYEMVVKYKGDMVRVVFEPNKKILDGMRSMAPRKVFFSLDRK